MGAAPRGITSPAGRWLRSLFAATVLAVITLPVAGPADAAEADGPVHLIAVTGEIDLGLAPFLQRALDSAERDDAAAVVLHLDTPGGRLDAVLQMRDALLDTTVPTVAFVDRMAFSAGALIALAADQIHMVPGAVMGAATPVDGSGATAGEKVVSAVRSTFRATAEERGREPLIAEAMVDPQVQIDGLTDEDSLLTLTASEAIDVGYADGIAADLDELLVQLGLSDRQVIDHELSVAERLVRFITNPVVASLLITIGVWLLVGDLLTGGIGIGAAAGATSLGLFFWGHLLAGLAGWEDVALLVLGVVLILVELVVVPGFGVAGVLGLASLLGGSFLAMLARDFDFVTGAQIARAATTVGVAFVAIMVGFVVLLSYLSRRHDRNGLILHAVAASSTGSLRPGRAARSRAEAAPRSRAEAAAPREDESEDHAPRGGELSGASGVAASDLRPAGIADVGGRRIDVVTEGEYIAAGEPVEIILDEGYRRIVRRSAN